jgi:hypothetical protein
MADNLRIFDSRLDAKIIRSSDIGGVHVPHHAVRILDDKQRRIKPGRPLNVSISITESPSISLVGSVTLSPTYQASSILVCGEASGGGRKLLTLSSLGRIEADIIRLPGSVNTGQASSPATKGVAHAGIQIGAASPQVNNGEVAPLTFDSQGRLHVALSAGESILRGLGTFTYNVDGSLQNISWAVGGDTAFSYNGIGELILVEDTVTNKDTNLTYNADGSVATAITA